MKQKFKNWGLLILITPLLAGIYGIIHGYITYGISHEFYTNFSFFHFNIDESLQSNIPISVGLVGFQFTWWQGIIIGFGLGGFGLWLKNSQISLRTKLKSVLITFCTSFIFGLLAYVTGGYIIDTFNLSDIFINTKDKSLDFKNAISGISSWYRFLTVCLMHIFGYFGAVIGIIIGCVYQYKRRISDNF